MSKKLENMDDFEMIDYILEKIRKNHDIIRNINKIDGLTSEHDILSFILERSLNSNKTLFEICKFKVVKIVKIILCVFLTLKIWFHRLNI